MSRRPVGSGQYTSAQFRGTLTRLRMRVSMGRVGSCFDNADAESFFASLQTEIATRISACGVQILRQGRDLGVGRDLPDDGVLKMNAFK